MSASDKPLAPRMVCQPIWIELGLPPEAALGWADTERDGCATLTWWDVLIPWHDSILSSVNTSGLPRSLRGSEFMSTCPGTGQSPRHIWEILLNCHVHQKKVHLPDVSLVTDLIPQLSFSEIPPCLYILNCAGVQKESKANLPTLILVEPQHHTCFIYPKQPEYFTTSYWSWQAPNASLLPKPTRDQLLPSRPFSLLSFRTAVT